MPSSIAIIGTQWGDEGKGKIVDILSENADYIVRFQGGNNAGHTVVVDGVKYIFHLLPSGILHEDKKCVLANGMVIDLEGLVKEIEFVNKLGRRVNGRLFVSERAHLILPYHREMDFALEKSKGKLIGTTLRGIGPAYADKSARIGIRVADVKDEQSFRYLLKENVRQKSKILEHVFSHKPGFTFDQIYTSVMRAYEKVESHICDTVHLLNREIDAGKRVMFEGAQATLLDIDMGTYPFVTSSNASSLGITTGTGVSPKKIGKIVGIVKSYTTRVGEGPFPTELTGPDGEVLRAKGHEYGSTTGRPRRCGWLDLFALKFSNMVNEFDGLIITKLDVLDGLDEIKVCVGYSLEGKLLESFPSTSYELEKVEPVYETFKGWREPVSSFKNFADLPGEATNLISFIEDYLGTKVVMISTGPSRSEIIKILPVW